MSAHKPIDEATGTATTGHVWDGISELNNPLPRWWLIILWATVVWAVVYMLLFPAIPLLRQAWPGLLGYSSRTAVEADLSVAAASRADLDTALAQRPFAEIRADAALFEHARRSGESAFKVACVQCHGSGAQGSQTSGYPNLSDDDWLWGGTLDEILASVSHGIRSADAETRVSEMPAFGTLGMLDANQIRDVTQHVLSLSGEPHDAEAAGRGAATFAAQCVACHGERGEGQRALGAPRLDDAIWLYGSTPAAVAAQVTQPRHGVMPAWSARFDEATRKALAVYVHSLGGGE